MKHRWSPTRYYRRTGRLTQLRHCVKCGGAILDISVLANEKSLPYPRAIYFAPFAGTWKQIWQGGKYGIRPGLPTCEGLPANYEAPIGA